MLTLPLVLLLAPQRITELVVTNVDGKAFLAMEAAAKDFRTLKFPPPKNQLENYTIDVERAAQDYMVSFAPKYGPEDAKGEIVGAITSLGLGMIFYVDIKTLKVRKRTPMP